MISLRGIMMSLTDTVSRSSTPSSMFCRLSGRAWPDSRTTLRSSSVVRLSLLRLLGSMPNRRSNRLLMALSATTSG